MIYWSMYKTKYLTEDNELVQRFPHAVSHDGENTVFVDIPDDTTDAYFLPSDMELSDLIFNAGGYLVSQQEIPMIGTKEQFVQLYNTPHYRIWCGMYNSVDELDADYILVFGSGLVDKLLPLETLIASAKEDVKVLVTP